MHIAMNLRVFFLILFLGTIGILIKFTSDFKCVKCAACELSKLIPVKNFIRDPTGYSSKNSSDCVTNFTSNLYSISEVQYISLKKALQRRSTLKYEIQSVQHFQGMSPANQKSLWNTRKPYRLLGERQKRAVQRKYRLVRSRRLYHEQQIRGPANAQITTNTTSHNNAEPTPVVEHIVRQTFPEVPNENVENLHVRENVLANDLNVTAEIPECTEADWDKLNFAEKMAHAFLSTRMNHVQATQVLRVLRTHNCHHDLPLDSRTLLKTPRKPAQIKTVQPGEYLHLGLESELLKILQICSNEDIPRVLEIDLHTDGADIYKKISAWPWQFRITNIPSVKKLIGVAGIYRGRKKPENAQEFCESLVDEYLEIIKNGGILFRGRRIQVRFRCFIGDALARAFILCHKSHGSTKPCSKCHVQMEKFETIRKTKKVRLRVYCGVGHRKRTDDTYVLRNDTDHHFEQSSPLENLGIGLVTQVPFEYMHLVLIGVVKKLFEAWIDGEHKKEARLKRNKKRLAADNFLAISKYIPFDFARKPCELFDFNTFKATEFRQILLFSGPAFLYGILTENMYINFLLLHASIRCLVYYSESEFHLRFAEIALERFVQGCESLYSKSFLTYNSHGLLHLVEDVRRLGDLDSFSAFAYENNMMLFAKLCRKPHQPLQQIVNRLAEQRNHVKSALCKTKPHIYAYDLHHRVDNTNGKYYNKLKMGELLFSTRSPDNCVKMNNDIFIISGIIMQNNEYFLHLYQYTNKFELYNVGISSMDIGVYLCSNLQRQTTVVSINNIKKKCFRAPLQRTNTTYSICDIDMNVGELYVIVEM